MATSGRPIERRVWWFGLELRENLQPRLIRANGSELYSNTVPWPRLARQPCSLVRFLTKAVSFSMLLCSILLPFVEIFFLSLLTIMDFSSFLKVASADAQSRSMQRNFSRIQG